MQVVFDLELCELSHEALIGFDMPLILDQCECAVQGELVCLHQVRYRYRRRSAHAHDAVDEDFSLRHFRLLYEVERCGEHLGDLGGRDVQDAQLEILCPRDSLHLFTAQR